MMTKNELIQFLKWADKQRFYKEKETDSGYETLACEYRLKQQMLEDQEARNDRVNSTSQS